MSKWDRKHRQTACCPQDSEQAADRHCSPIVSHRPGVKKVTNSGEKEPSPLAAVGLNQRFLAALVWSHLLPLLHASFLTAWLCRVCLPSGLALLTLRKDQQHRKLLQSNRLEVSSARARTRFVGTSNLAIIQSRILGRKECVFTQKLLREKSWLSIKGQDHQGKEHLP